MSSVKNFLYLCRLCGSETVPDCRINIFDNNGVSLDLNTKLTKCIGIYVRETDILPKVMCHGCLNQVEYMYTFRNMCYETAKNLKDVFYKQLNSTVDSNNETELQSREPDFTNNELQVTPQLIEEQNNKAPEKVEAEINNASYSEVFKLKGKRGHKFNTRGKTEMFQCLECKCVVYFRETAIKHVESEHNVIVIRKSNNNSTVPPSNQEKSDDLVRKEKYFFEVIEKICMDRQLISSVVPTERPYVCQICKKSYQDKSSFRNHKIVHNKHRRIYTCDICNKTFLSPHAAAKHKLSHELTLEERKSFKCKECTASFTTMSALDYHIESNHINTPKVECKICFKIFKNSKILRMHSVIHSENKKVCSVCDKVFSSNYLLKVHSRLHTNERPYSCDECQRGYIKKSSLTCHIKRCHWKYR